MTRPIFEYFQNKNQDISKLNDRPNILGLKSILFSPTDDSNNKKKENKEKEGIIWEYLRTIG